MKTLKLTAAALSCMAAATVLAQEPAWNASAIKECDRACLVGVLDGYLSALFKKDPKAVPCSGVRRPSLRASNSPSPIP